MPERLDDLRESIETAIGFSKCERDGGFCLHCRRGDGVCFKEAAADLAEYVALAIAEPATPEQAPTRGGAA